MRCFLFVVAIFSVNAHAATFVPYNPFTRTAFIVGEGLSEEIAISDARRNIPKTFQQSDLLSSALIDCSSEPGKCKYFLPLEPSGNAELANYKNIIEHHELGTTFKGYGRTMANAEKDLLLKTGKKSLSAFVGNITRTCPVGFKGADYKNCLNSDEAGNFIVATGLPRSCFLTE